MQIRINVSISIDLVLVFSVYIYLLSNSAIYNSVVLVFSTYKSRYLSKVLFIWLQYFLFWYSGICGCSGIYVPGVLFICVQCFLFAYNAFRLPTVRFMCVQWVSFLITLQAWGIKSFLYAYIATYVPTVLFVHAYNVSEVQKVLFMCGQWYTKKKTIFFEVELNSLSNSRMQKFNTILNLTMELCNHTITYVIGCAIWHHLHNLKNVKHTHGGMLLLVKLQAFSLQLY